MTRTPRALALVLVPMATGVLTLGLADMRAQQPKSGGEQPSTIAMHADPRVLFKTSDNCVACHNSLTAPSGEDVSMGSNWRATIMANSARDPYWHASVRREVLDHPKAASDIEDECAICHMPMATALAHAGNAKGQVFAHLPVADRDSPEDRLAHDGVSCALCHQIRSDKLGTRESFVGGFVIAGEQPGPRPVYGPFDVEKGLTTVMRSSAEFQPTQGLHVQQSELCATCHTLITKALNANGDVIGELPEQAMYLEWRHSAFVTERKSCQSCHMPAVAEPMPIASVLGQPREGFSRHVFVGGNFFVLRMLNRFRLDLGVEALPQELDASALRTIHNLNAQTAAVSIERPAVAANRLEFDVDVQNLTGHKLPTAYPSRRSWLHVTVRDANGGPVFESGAITPSGLIEGNDADADATKFEPHYREIRQPGEVQIYESVMGDASGVPTTGLLTAVRYLKDNRLLPRGFDKTTAEKDIQVIGDALGDLDFVGGRDMVRYSIDTAGRQGPFQIEVELRFQPIAYRWAQNLERYDAPETKRFVGYYESMSADASEALARTRITAR